MTTDQKGLKISWYRSPVNREVLAELNQRSDLKGLVQSLGHLGLLVITGAAAWYAAGQLPIFVLPLILFLHGTIFAFLLNGFHELCHKTVFKSKNLNTFFLYLVSFLGWHHPTMFWASHQEHHKYTLHPPQDQEVMLPIKLKLSDFLKSAIINPWDLVGRTNGYIRLSTGRLKGNWENRLFPESNIKSKKALINWARFHLIGHIVLVAVSLYFGLWLIPILVTLAPFYGGWLLFLCNNTQHIGLQDKVPDFRLCCRTIYLNPFVRFIYWHMNYHTEHHMYAAIPCYNLATLHAHIKNDLPPCPNGLYAAWKEIIDILKKQESDPEYQYTAPLPEKAGIH
jgi:fatty acid desaturase